MSLAPIPKFELGQKVRINAAGRPVLCEADDLLNRSPELVFTVARIKSYPEPVTLSDGNLAQVYYGGPVGTGSGVSDAFAVSDKYEQGIWECYLEPAE